MEVRMVALRMDRITTIQTIPPAVVVMAASTRLQSCVFYYPPSSPPPINPSTLQIVVVVVVVIIALVCAFLFLRIVRSRNANPKYLPKPLKKLWTKWDVSPSVTKAKYSRTGDGHDDRFQNRMRMREAQDNLEDALQDALAQQESANGNAANGQGQVNRNTSVRSVMTLPAYRPQAAETEQVLGREGERGGIDTVVEMPTAEDEEAMREEEMEALYQIRLARRRQIAEREERRQERREARERNDNRTLVELRARARQANEEAHRDLEELRDQHDNARQIRQRAVSSVSYADLGVVRADGTRLRADSVDSERMGLLSDAASIGLRNRDSNISLQHRRAPSSQSVLSIDTGRSSHERVGSPVQGTARSRASSRGPMSGPMTESYTTVPRAGSAMSQRAGSSPELIDAAEADLGDNVMPPHSPPGYDDVSLEDVSGAPAELTRSNHTGGSDLSDPSGRNSPYNEPPPDYSPGGANLPQQQQQQQEQQQPRESPTQARQNRLSAQMADLAAQEQQIGTSTELQAPQADRGHTRTTSRGVGGIPQLPSLRLNRLPQIVIEPSSAYPRDDEHELDDRSGRR